MDNNLEMLVELPMINNPDLGSIALSPKFNTQMMKTVWLIKLGFNTSFESDKKYVQFVSGVCIGSNGYILTSAKALKPVLQRDSKYKSSDFSVKRVRGRPYDHSTGNPSGTYKLDRVFSDGDLLVFKVVDRNTPSFNYVGVNELFVRLGADLLCVTINGDETFSGIKCYVSKPAGTMKELAEEPKVVLRRVLPRQDVVEDVDGIKYLPIYGVMYTENVEDFGKRRLLNTTSGSPVFDQFGRLVGVMSMGLPDFCFAIPVVTEFVKRFEESLSSKVKKSGKRKHNARKGRVNRQRAEL